MLFQAVAQLVWSRVHERWNVSPLFIYPYHYFYIRVGPGFRLSTTEFKPVPSVKWSLIKIEPGPCTKTQGPIPAQSWLGPGWA